MLFPGALFGPILDPRILVFGACLQSAAFLLHSLKQTGHFWLLELPGPFWALEGTLRWGSPGALLASLGLPGALGSHLDPRILVLGACLQSAAFLFGSFG